MDSACTVEREREIMMNMHVVFVTLNKPGEGACDGSETTAPSSTFPAAPMTSLQDLFGSRVTHYCINIAHRYSPIGGG